ncbi:hypothetical protein [Bifidobacterium thermophilum]|uniref:Uncharacterized protein n=1 Tax=Bifidobacterium thermophilum TaxID=33905 RepID=A0A7X9RKV5_9BIFI|nr:hypothetical protein [Bifidobacterium thermophilum]NME61923.1 hypothetical protein [Bifidobacterium thermophilum]
MNRNTTTAGKSKASLAAWFENTPEYGQCRELGVSDFDIDAIESDLALYVKEHDIGDFGDIPEAELVAAIADHTDTRTRLYFLLGFWGAEFDGYYSRGGCWYHIDLDQAVNDDGKAVYDRYELTVIVSAFDGLPSSRRIYRFTAADIEDFARTR